MRKDIEFRDMMGDRADDCDGFTYLYGKYKDGRHAARNKKSLRASVRNDKRSIKQKAWHRIRKEEEF